MQEYTRHYNPSSITEELSFQIHTGIDSTKKSFEINCLLCDNNIVGIFTKTINSLLDPQFGIDIICRYKDKLISELGFKSNDLIIKYKYISI